MPFPIQLEGRGVAAACCASLLSAKGLDVRLSGAMRSTLPGLLLNAPTIKLLSDVFPQLNLRAHARPIRKRVVQWGLPGERVELPHAGAVIAEKALLDELWKQVTTRDKTQRAFAWQIYSTSARMQSTLNFGLRVAALAEVDLAAKADGQSCWVEGLREGWLFLLPVDAGRAMLIATGPEPHQLLSESQLIAPLLGEMRSPFQTAPAYPRIADPLCAPGWLACGGAALAFDPLCGEGTGHAVREAILASAILRRLAAMPSEDPAALLRHYRERLIAGFQKHLETCVSFYETGGDSPWWRAELESLQTGLRWTHEQLSPASVSRYCLVDFDLQLRG